MESDDRLAVIARLIVRPSFQRCDEQGNDFFDAFYASLAQQAQVGALFANTDMRKQNALIREGLNHLIAHAEGQQSAQAELKRLGKRHSRDDLNISPELYPAWVDSLVAAVAEFDSLHNADLETAWRHVVAPGIDVMVSCY